LTKEREEPHFLIEPLGARHDRAAFSCSNQQLDSYLQKQAGQDLKKRDADQAVAFYRKYGFIDLPKIEKRLFLPMGTIAQLFSEDG
jgi:hypothetical protein